MPYPSAEALVAASTGAARAALDALDDPALDDLRTSAIAAVEEHCGQRFTLTVEQRVLDADGGTLLLLPERLEALTAIEVLGTSFTVDDFILLPARNALRVRPLATSSAYLRAMADMDPDVRRRALPAAAAAVAITGSWGWAVTPPAVGVALRIDMEDNALADENHLSSSVQAYRAMGLRSIRQGNLNADLGGVPGLSSKAKRALAGLVWTDHGATA